jgi:hypothetical protein
MPVHLPATGSVWAISDTANKTVTMARGLLEAATSDDISPAALLACGSFGSLLPVSPETRLKVEQLARRNHTSHVLNFIKAQIGYKKDDSVEQLSRSDSGIRFLCLVTTLCTLDHYDAADRLDAMLQATQQGFQIRPTIRQLQVMLNSMKTKMILSDFATSVAGFETILRASLEGQGAPYQIGIAQIPTKESLQELVIAMNQLGRIAEEDSIETVDVRLNSCYAPWTCAFIKWLLGVPPLVRTVQGKTLLQQDQASVTLTILSRSPGSNPNKRTADGKAKLEVVPVQKIRGFRDIIFLEPTSEPRYGWQGLVSAQDWFDYQFSVLFDKVPQLRKEGKLRNAFGQALYFIVTTLPERLVFCDDFGAFKSGMSHCDGNVEDLFHPTAAKAFLNHDIRVRIANELVKGHITLVQEDNDESGTLLPHNLAKTLKAGCRQCQNPTNGIIAGQLPCKVHELLEGIGELGSMLLTLSLFGPHSEAFPMLKAGLMFDTTPFHHRLYPLRRKQAISSASFSKLIMTGWQALMHGQCAYLSCPPMTIFQHAAKMMGHQKIWDSTIISSLYGQVLFPAFFEARDFLSEGFLQMSAFPGKLQKGEMQFDFLLDSWSNKINTEGVSDAETEEVDSDPEGEGHDDVERSGGSSTGADDEQMEEVDLEDPQDDHEEQRDLNNESQDHLDSALMSTTNVNAGRTARKLVPASFARARRRLILSAEVMKWSISVRDEMLHGELRLQEDGEMMIAWSLIESLARARLSPACPHPYNNPAGELADSFELAPNAGLREHGWPRSLIVAGQSYAGQLNALQAQDSYPPVIVHIDGCIQCAMRLGLADRVRVVIS